MENDKAYRIKDIRTGLYSLGGERPRFTKRGKLWTSLKNIKLHTDMIYKKYKFDYETIGSFIDMYNNPYRFCVIEILELKKIDMIEIDQIMIKKEK